MKILQYLPQEIARVVEKYSQTIQELRLRQDKPTRVKIGQAWYYVGQNGVQTSTNKAYVCSGQDINHVLQGACDKSIYAYEKQLVNGFLTLSDGTRIGVGGSVSISDSAENCFSSYSSLCVRIPHFVSAYGSVIFQHFADGVKNCLVIGQPCSGKTTVLRELSCLLSQSYNVVVVDERGELTLCEKYTQNSTNVDTLLFAQKKYAITTAVRSLSPDVIICDELTEEDFCHIKYALSNGVAICASIHGNDMSKMEVLAKAGVNFDMCCLLNKNHSIPPVVFSAKSQ